MSPIGRKYALPTFPPDIPDYLMYPDTVKTVSGVIAT